MIPAKQLYLLVAPTNTFVDRNIFVLQPVWTIFRGLVSSFSTSVLHVATQTVGVHRGERDHPGGFLQSPCSAPAQPCHHGNHGFPQQGGGAPVPEQGLFCSQNLYGGRRVLGQVCEAAGMRDQTSSNLKVKNILCH